VRRVDACDHHLSGAVGDDERFGKIDKKWGGDGRRHELSCEHYHFIDPYPQHVGNRGPNQIRTLETNRVAENVLSKSGEGRQQRGVEEDHSFAKLFGCGQ